MYPVPGVQVFKKTMITCNRSVLTENLTPLIKYEVEATGSDTSSVYKNIDKW